MDEILRNMSYETWCEESIKLYKLVDLAEYDLLLITKNTSRENGLIEDSITQSIEYKKARAQFNLSFKSLQAFNKSSPKAYMNKKRKEHLLNNL